MVRTDILNKKKQILEWIEQNQPKAFMCKELKCKQSTLNSYLEKMGIEYAGNQGGRGHKMDPKRLSAKEYASKEYGVSSHRLKLKLFEDNIRDKKCERCNLSEWLGLPISLELHHIDGDRSNNNFDNLQILCPNCHALTPNHSGKKTRKAQVAER